MVGIVYEITNVEASDDAMILNERSFYRLGDLSLGLSRHHLKAGQSALLYVCKKVLS
jgi:hypothetical protein